MELNVVYSAAEHNKSWHDIKKYTKPNSIRLAFYTVSGNDIYDMKKTILNTLSRLKTKNGILFVRCNMEEISQLLSIAEEITSDNNLYCRYNYNITSEYCNETSKIHFVLSIGPDLLDNKIHRSKSYATEEDLSAIHINRILNNSKARDICLLFGDIEFLELANTTIENARYMIGFTNSTKGVDKYCEKNSITVKGDVHEQEKSKSCQSTRKV